MEFGAKIRSPLKKGASGLSFAKKGKGCIHNPLIPFVKGKSTFLTTESTEGFT